jgi:hypothetical protein
VTARRALLALFVALALPYACSPVYRFPEPAPFAGAAFYNPYADVRGQWKRANLHAHGTAWGGLTNGVQPSAEVARTYRSLGYDIAGVSNYHEIATHNVSKRHQLAIGAHRVEWFDFPLWQWSSQEQFIIDRVRDTAALVGLTHPLTRGAYSNGELLRLTGYQLIEVANGPFESQAPWDAALSSGHAVWAMANDDTHDTGDPRRTAMAWNMIDAPSTSSADIIGALRAGRSYAVSRNDDAPAAMDAQLAGVEVVDGTIHVTIEGAPSDFQIVGQDGAVRIKATDAVAASYTLRPQDTYIRTVIRTPRTTMYLNPVIRYDGRALPAPAAAVDPVRTWMLRGVWALALAFAALRLWPRRTAVDRVPSAAAADTDRETA